MTARAAGSSSRSRSARTSKSAQELNTTLQGAFDERDIFRIDHYLGKETVQNLIYFRFANSIYEPLWNRIYIDHVQITVAEQVGVEGRGGYYDNAGASRDMLQNHLFQLFTLTAMEAPASLDAESIRDEKVKVLRSIPTPSPNSCRRTSCARNTAAASSTARPSRPIARRKRSRTTRRRRPFVAARFEIDNWRWHGVPFYLRTGKALAAQFTEINIVFKRPPSVLFAANQSPGQRQWRRAHAPQHAAHPHPAERGHRHQVQREGARQGRGGVGRHGLPLQERLRSLSARGVRAAARRCAGRRIDALHPQRRGRAGVAPGRLGPRDVGPSRPCANLPLYACGSMGPVESDLLLERSNRAWIQPPELKK